MAGGGPGGGARPIVVVAGDRQRAAPALEALAAVGLDPERAVVVVPDPRDPAGAARAAAERVAGAAGVMLLGGGDPHPSTYGQEPLPEARLQLEPGRDELEIAAIQAARAGGVPAFGICRGMQMINVVLGGTLWQDVPTQLPGALLHDQSYPRDALIHAIEVEAAESGLGAVLAAETALVNSRHHQGVAELAPELAVVGRAPDRLVEAFAGRDPEWWVEGVQWHPENLLPLAQQRAVVARFAAAVAAFEARGR